MTSNLKIIGTSHIAKQSMQEVEKAIEKDKPGIIALELDHKRYYSLQQKNRKINFYSIFRVGVKGFLFALIGAWAEKKLGKFVGVSPGSEMLRAIKIAKKNKIKLAFIDQDIEITLRRISKYFTWKERFNFIADIFKGIFNRKKEMEELGIQNLDLTKVPAEEIIEKMINKVRKRYPNLYRVLISERNSVMAKNLKYLTEKFPDKKIIAIMGAGHEKGVKEILENQINYKFTFSG